MRRERERALVAIVTDSGNNVAKSVTVDMGMIDVRYNVLEDRKHRPRGMSGRQLLGVGNT